MSERWNAVRGLQSRGSGSIPTPGEKRSMAGWQQSITDAGEACWGVVLMVGGSQQKTPAGEAG